MIITPPQDPPLIRVVYRRLGAIDEWAFYAGEEEVGCFMGPEGIPQELKDMIFLLGAYGAITYADDDRVFYEDALASLGM